MIAQLSCGEDSCEISVMEATEAPVVKVGAKRRREDLGEDEGGAEYCHVTDKELKRRLFKVGGKKRSELIFLLEEDIGEDKKDASEGGKREVKGRALGRKGRTIGWTSTH